jgi:hypothetical protein
LAGNIQLWIKGNVFTFFPTQYRGELCFHLIK